MTHGRDCEESLERDSLTDALQTQVAFYKGEYENLKLETKSLIGENTEMSKQIEAMVTKTKQVDDLYESRENDKEMIRKLQIELDFLSKEKLSYESLWRSAQDAVKSLENEMRTYQRTNPKPSIVLNSENEQYKNEYSAIIKMLESKLNSAMNDIKSKEDLAKTLTNEKNEIKKILEGRDSEITSCNEKLDSTINKNNMLENKLSELKNELQTCRLNMEDAIKKAEIFRQSIDLHAKKEFESRTKVVEALKLVDEAISERDSALLREKRAIDESTRLSNQITEVLNESTVRIQKEVDIAKQSYNDKLNNMLIHIQRLELEMGEKNLALERSLRENTVLEERLHSSKYSSNNDDEKDSKILLLEQKMEAAFQQLILSERRNIQILSEKENLQMDLDQLTNNFQRDKRKWEWEEKLRINETSSLKIQIGNLKDTLHDAHQTIQRLQSHILSKADIEEKLVNDKFILTSEFEKHFEIQQKHNLKWKQSMKDIIQKLEVKIEELSSEIERLQRENENLQSQCV